MIHGAASSTDMEADETPKPEPMFESLQSFAQILAKT